MSEEVISTDPVSGQSFSGVLDDGQICDIMEARCAIDESIEVLQNHIDEESKALEEKLKNLKEEVRQKKKELQEYDEKYMAGVRAAVFYNRENYNRVETNTPYYQISTRVPKKPNPVYDHQDEDLALKIRKQWPSATKIEVKRQNFNKILKEMDPKEFPEGVKLQTPPPSVTMTRLTVVRKDKRTQ